MSSPTPTPSPTPKEVNFKTLATDFETLANFHKQLNSFGLGDIDQLSYWTQSRLKEDNTTYNSPYYPLLYIVPSKVENDLQYKVWEFNTTVSDIVEDSLQNNEDTLSDTLQILQDVISQFRWSNTSVLGNYYDKYFLDDDVECTPFLGEEDDNLNGWNGLLRIKTMTALDRCAAAFNTWTGSPITHPEGINLKTFTDDFRILSDFHKQIQSFGFGKMDEFTYWNEMRLKENNTHFNSPYYPYFFVIPNTVMQKFGFMEYKFTFIVSDIIQRDLANQVDVLSDTLQIMDDILGQFRLSVTQSLGNFNELYYLDTPITCTPFLEKYDDLLGGWIADVTIQVETPLDRCDAAFNPFVTPTPTPSNTSSPTPTPSQTPTFNPITPSPTPTSTQTSTPTVTPTRTPSATPTQTQTSTPTVTPTCPVTTQYLEVELFESTKFKLILWNQPNFTSPATSNCDYIISGVAYGSLGTVFYGQETILAGQHQHQFNLAPVLQPGEIVTGFDVLSYTLNGCPCPVNLVLPISPTPTPSPTSTTTPTPTNTPTPSVTTTMTPTNTATPTNTPTTTTSPTPSSTPAPILILDIYTGATIAYSTRKLRTSYTGNCLRVRRSSDNAEQDIGFNGSNLDTTSLLNFITGSTDGRVTTWYDQSGNGNNLTQTTVAKQPWIVSGGTLVTYNSKPVLEGKQTAVASTNTGMIQSADITVPFLISTAFLEKTSGVGRRALSANNQNSLISNRRNNNNTVYTNETIYNPMWSSNGVMQVTTFRKISTTSTLSTDTTLLLSGITGGSKLGTIGIGGNNNFTTSEASDAQWGEVIAWNASITDINFSGISNNQQTYWV